MDPLPARPVRCVMRRRWISISPLANLSDALQTMRLARLRRLPVVADGILVGVLSYSDLLGAALANGGSGLPDRLVRDLAREAESATLDMPLGEVALRMLRDAGGFLPVVEATSRGRQLLGVVTESDLLRLAYDPWFGATSL